MCPSHWYGMPLRLQQSCYCCFEYKPPWTLSWTSFAKRPLESRVLKVGRQEVCNFQTCTDQELKMMQAIKALLETKVKSFINIGRNTWGMGFSHAPHTGMIIHSLILPLCTSYFSLYISHA